VFFVLTLLSHFSGVLYFLFVGPARHKVFVVVNVRANKPLLEIRVNHAGSLRSFETNKETKRTLLSEKPQQQNKTRQNNTLLSLSTLSLRPLPQ
jgi:hypothetical protein